MERRLALPHVSEASAREILRQHEELLADGCPPDAVLRHAEWEMGVFRAEGVPAAVIELIEADHREFEHALTGKSGPAGPDRITPIRRRWRRWAAGAVVVGCVVAGVAAARS